MGETRGISRRNVLRNIGTTTTIGLGITATTQTGTASSSPVVQCPAPGEAYADIHEDCQTLDYALSANENESTVFNIELTYVRDGEQATFTDQVDPAGCLIATDVGSEIIRWLRIRITDQAGNLLAADQCNISREHCMNGGWEMFGFKNLGLCIQCAETDKECP